ncbi:hypothetical protein DPEC_G00303720 [Dallia pectoralis]|uniref:Uncharacterized protein n=1 Tax=Dallia pectoralis TaxID=75939 RepID=A0ACC2FDP2_DALPE|nr:hypothetical protein DPEC_G00303720 [Dallia pectoralis]
MKGKGIIQLRVPVKGLESLDWSRLSLAIWLPLWGSKHTSPLGLPGYQVRSLLTEAWCAVSFFQETSSAPGKSKRQEVLENTLRYLFVLTRCSSRKTLGRGLDEWRGREVEWGESEK